jgi:hypothetical protein
MVSHTVTISVAADRAVLSSRRRAPAGTRGAARRCERRLARIDAVTSPDIAPLLPLAWIAVALVLVRTLSAASG